MADTSQQSTSSGSAQPSVLPALPTMNPEDSPYKPLDLPQQQPHQAAPPDQDKPPADLGATSHAGAAAYLIDHVLKGAAQGTAKGMQYAADQYNKKLSAVQSLYNDQAAQLYTIAKEGRAGTFTRPAGADGKPTFVPSPEFTATKGRMLVAWQAMMQTVGERIPQPKKGKKSTSQQASSAGTAGAMGGGGDTTEQIKLALSHKDDPQGSLAAIYQIGQQIGPPVVHQITGFLTPEYVGKQGQAAQQQQIEGQVGTVTATNQLSTQQAQATKNRVLLISEANRSDKDKQDLQSAEDILAPGAKATAATYKEFFSLADPKQKQWYDVTKEVPQGWSAVPVGAGSNRAPKEGWTKQDGKWGSQLYDPETNQPIPGTFNASKAPPASVQSLFPRESSFHNFFVDSNGVRQEFTATNTSRKDLPPGMGQGGAGGTSGETGASVSPPSQSSPSNTPTAATLPHPKASKPAAAATTLGGGATGSLHPIAYQGSKAYKDLQTSADKAKAVATDATAQSKLALGYLNNVLKDPKNGSAKMGLVATFLRNVIGAHPASGSGGASVRITNAEWQMAIQSRPWLAGALSHIDGKDGTIITGVTLTPQQAHDMAYAVYQSAAESQKSATNLAASAKEQREKDMHAGGLIPPATALHDDEIMNLLHPKQ